MAESPITSEEFAELIPHIYAFDNAEIDAWNARHVTTYDAAFQYTFTITLLISGYMLHQHGGNPTESGYWGLTLHDDQPEQQRAGQLLTAALNGDHKMVGDLVFALLETNDDKLIGQTMALLIYLLHLTITSSPEHPVHWPEVAS